MQIFQDFIQEPLLQCKVRQERLTTATATCVLIAEFNEITVF